MSQSLRCDRLPDPVTGEWLTVYWRGDALIRTSRDEAEASIQRGNALSAFPELADLLACRPARLDRLTFDLSGSFFQRRVWNALAGIPFGSTISYAALAGKLGLPPGAARAVGTACGRNPLPRILPCHRVVTSAGGLGGFIWGTDYKRRLLAMESLGLAQGSLFAAA